MNIEELKKDYKEYLKSTQKEDTPANKKLYKIDCLNWFIEFYGIGSDEVLLIQKELMKL